MTENAVVNIDTTELTVKAAAIAEVCAAHNVFPDYDTEELAFEKTHFISQIVRYAEEPKRWSYLELTYHNSLVRFIIKTNVIDGIAKLTAIGAYDHPHASATMDYDALNEAIKAV